MSGPLVSASAAFVAKNSRIPPFAIEQSLRIAQGSYLYRTNSSSGNLYTWTYSCWVKRGTFTQAIDAILAANQNYGNDWNSDSLQFNTGNFGLQIYNNRNQSTRANGTTNAKYRDPSAWMHIVAVWDNTNSTATDKFRYYINGERATIAWSTTPTGDSSLINSTTTMRIGQNASVNSEKYMAEVHFIDGTAVTNANDFGEYDDNGVWRPIEYTGSYGTNGFYLKFDPSATNGVGHDHSGNGNNWSLQNIVTSGTGTDVMSDTPTTNWCTLNPGYKAVSGATISEGNLKVAYPSAPPTGMHVGTLATTNAFYVEAKALAATSNQIYLGVETPDRGNINNNYPGGGPDGWGYGMNGNIYNNGSTVSSTGTTYTTNDLIGIACDPSSGTIEFFKNGTSVYSGTSVANVPLTICVSQSGGSGNSGTIEINCGQRAYEQTAPSGFSPLNTSNLSAPDIADGSEYFNTVLYTGNGSTQSITGVGFQPDWAWIKVRSEAYSHDLYDAVRGVQKSLASNGSAAEVTQTDGLSSFDTDGFSLGGRWNVNKSSSTYVAWNWLAGGSTTSNTDGSITSTVSANPTAGFSIVTFNKNTANTVTSTFGHGLGVAPKMIIVKHRDQSDNWRVYTETTGNNARLQLNTTDAVITPTNTWGTTSPTSTVFSMEGVLTGEYVAYCFAEVEGYSKFGSYTGNGNADGPFVYCGFRPSFLLFKRTNAAEDWVITDSVRRTYNQMNGGLRPNGDYIEFSSDDVAFDFTANGFKIRATDVKTNGSGSTYIFMALAENPFGGSGVSPATAR